MSADWLHDNDEHYPLAHPEGWQAPETTDRGPGYHLRTFDRGVYGDSSKILEEVLELQDAEAQGAKIMGLHELSDIIGAVRGYLMKHHPGYTLVDLISMANITERAFKNGQRTSSPPQPASQPPTPSSKTKIIEECWRCHDFHLHPDDCPRDPGPAHP